MQEHHKYNKLLGSVTVVVSCSSPCPSTDSALTLTEKLTPLGVAGGNQDTSRLPAVHPSAQWRWTCVVLYLVRIKNSKLPESNAILQEHWNPGVLLTHVRLRTGPAGAATCKQVNKQPSHTGLLLTIHKQLKGLLCETDTVLSLFAVTVQLLSERVTLKVRIHWSNIFPCSSVTWIAT